MRPRSLAELVGQDRVLGPGSPLRRLLDDDAGMSLLLSGPPGSGKTTIAALLGAGTRRRFVELSAVSAGVKDVREVVSGARQEMSRGGPGTVLFLDEVHRFSKTQQDALLPAVENQWVSLVAATTENPYIAVITPLLSRSLVVTLQPLDDEAVGQVVDRAVTDPRGLAGGFSLAPGARAQLVRLSGGDARRALTYLEAAAAAASSRAIDVIDADLVALASERAVVRYDRQGDEHYDITSALIKSIRGSDVDAALHYLARMVEAGEDPRFLARRLVILASEDVGVADPSALPTAVAAAQAAALVGMPEARLPLAHAVISLAMAPKSNAVIRAIDAAVSDVRDGRLGSVPPALRDAHSTLGRRSIGADSYAYPHDDPLGVVPQQYPPDELVGRDYYHPSPHGAESAYVTRLQRLRQLLRGAGDGAS